MAINTISAIIFACMQGRELKHAIKILSNAGENGSLQILGCLAFTVKLYL
jgi:hypothetical protein